MGYVTIKDVAMEAGVSVPAVSQVINGKGRLSEATRLRVTEAIRKLNYIPNSAARSMRSSESKTIGLLVPDIGNSYFASLISAVNEVLAKDGYACLIGSSAESLEGQDKFLRSLLSQRIDGSIIVPQGQASPGLERFLATDLPVVFLDRSLTGMERAEMSVPIIDSDPYPGMRAAIQTAHELGHRSIGFVSGPVRESPNLKEREDAFRTTATKELGASGAVVAGATDAVQAVDELMALGIRTFIFGYSPDALAAIRLFRDRSLMIGKDVSLMSFDDIPLFELATPAISVISQQVTVMGHKGAKALLALMKAHQSQQAIPHTENSVRIPTQYIHRQSLVNAAH